MSCEARSVVKVGIILAMLAALPALGGCADSSRTPDIALPPVGDASLPPGPFREGAANLAVYEEFFTGIVPRLPCIGEGHRQQFVDAANQERYHALVDTF